MEEKSKNIIEKINFLKNSLMEKLSVEKNQRQEQIENELKFFKSLEVCFLTRKLIILQNPVRINLLSSSIFCSYASKLDLLHCYSDLSKAVQVFLN